MASITRRMMQKIGNTRSIGQSQEHGHRQDLRHRFARPAFIEPYNPGCTFAKATRVPPSIALQRFLKCYLQSAKVSTPSTESRDEVQAVRKQRGAYFDTLSDMRLTSAAWKFRLAPSRFSGSGGNCKAWHVSQMSQSHKSQCATVHPGSIMW